MVCKFQIRELQKEKPEDVSEGLFALSCGPDPQVKTCKACSVNVAPRRGHGRLRHRAQARRRGDGVLEGVGSVGGEAEVGLSATSAESRVAAARERIRSNRERGPDSILR